MMIAGKGDRNHRALAQQKKRSDTEIAECEIERIGKPVGRGLVGAVFEDIRLGGCNKYVVVLRNRQVGNI